MQYLQSLTTVRGVFLLLLATALLSLAGCKGGGGGKGGGGAAATASAISTGNAHTCAIVGGKAAWCWGGNASGKLGNDDTADSSTPVAVNMLDSGVTAISAGNNHTCAIHNTAGEDETEVLAAKCWGAGGSGRLGNDDTEGSPIPVQVTGLVSGVSAISAGGSHTCAIHSGAAMCWGFNNFGRLGDDSTDNRMMPVQVDGLDSGVTAISAGAAHTCAILSTGAAQCWGSGGSGRLGNGDTTESHTPVEVDGLGSDVTAISAGSDHTCAIHEHAAKCWGSGTNGRLGNGSNDQSLIPMQVSGLGSGVTAISAGQLHTCAIHNGAAKCWGSGNNGRLGDDSTTESNIAVQVTGMEMDVTAISAGDFHTCAIHNDITKCWGFNSNGQLGVGELAASATSALTPQTLSF